MTDILVLAYHAISRDWPAALSVFPERFEQQLNLLAARGYRGATLHDAVHEPQSGRVVAVTFDDAYVSVLEVGFPILQRIGFPATVFVPTDFPEHDGPMSWAGIDHWLGSPHEHELACLSWAQLRLLADEGWEIGTHGCSHPMLTLLTEEQLAHELRESREVCERELERPCLSLAYPYGMYDERVINVTRATGYTTACTVPNRLESVEPLAWPRLGIWHNDGELSFRVKVSRTVRRVRTTPAAEPLLSMLHQVSRPRTKAQT